MRAAHADFTVTTTEVGHSVAGGAAIRLVPVGELDIATAPIFLGALAAALDRRPASVQIDLRWLAFIDARNVGAIATAATRVEAWGGRLAVCRADRGIRRMFDLCRLAHLLIPEAPGTCTPVSTALLPDLAARMAVAANPRGTRV